MKLGKKDRKKGEKICWEVVVLLGLRGKARGPGKGGHVGLQKKGRKKGHFGEGGYWTEKRYRGKNVV